MKIEENICLAPYTTMQVGGAAKYFVEPTNDNDVVEALQWARTHRVPVFVLGGGSNLLVSDAGFDGLVLHMAIGGIFTHEDGERRSYFTGAGVEWDTLVDRAVEDNCAGVECLSGIPGTVGGTPVQNVGAYGQDVSETISRVYTIDATTLERVEFNRAACNFSYRQSRFNNRDLGRYIITRVDFSLQPNGAPKLAYADLKRRFSDKLEAGATPSLRETREAILAIRRAKGMVLDEQDADSRSAGSFFKNPIVSIEEFQRIDSAFNGPVPHFEATAGYVKLAAAWLIEQAGINRGFAIGPVAISSKHTLALTNRGGATASDVLVLKEFVQNQVREQFGVELSPEPVMLGFDGHK